MPHIGDNVGAYHETREGGSGLTLTLDPCRQANVGWLADDLRFTSNCLLPPKLPPSGVQREAPEISSIAARRPRRYTPKTGRLRYGWEGFGTNGKARPRRANTLNSLVKTGCGGRI